MSKFNQLKAIAYDCASCLIENVTLALKTKSIFCLNIKPKRCLIIDIKLQINLENYHIKLKRAELYVNFCQKYRLNKSQTKTKAL